MGYFIKKAITGNEGLIISDDRRPQTPITGLLRYNVTTNGLEYFNGTVYVELAKTGTISHTVDTFVANGILVTFSGLSYAPLLPKDILVFINGVYQDPVTNYTTTGTDITFTAAPPINMPITIIHSTSYVDDANVIDVPNL